MHALRSLGLKSLVLLLAVTAGPGCTRRFFRNRTDADVARLLTEKNQFADWGIDHWWVYPHKDARFFDPTNPDRPPMPPDDPATAALTPRPQKPGKAGIGLFEGTGYLDRLAAWDAMNRADPEVVQPDPPPSEIGGPDGQAVAQADKEFLLKLEQSVELGIINSREFQDQRENLYITALPVSLQRFSFAAQFFSNGTVTRESNGRLTAAGRRERWASTINNGFTKRFATGALLLAQFANQISLEMLNGRPNTSVSSLTLELTQPLLQGGGRAVNLEPLTQAERNLVYAIRAYARFRKIFFVSVATGNTASTGGFNDVAIGLGLGAGSFTPNAGYLPAVQRAGELEVDRRNVLVLQDLLRRYESFAEGGEVSQLQVDQVKQDLLRGRSSVLQRELQYRSAVDNFKLQLGLPPTLQLAPDMAPLRPVKQQMDRYQQVIDQYNALREEAERDPGAANTAQARGRLKTMYAASPLLAGTPFRDRFAERWGLWEKRPDDALAAAVKALVEERRLLLERRTRLEVEKQPIPDDLRQRLVVIDLELATAALEDLLRQYEKQPWLQLQDPTLRERRRQSLYRAVANAFALVMTEPRNHRFDRLRESWPAVPPAVVDGVDLIANPLDVAYGKASQVAVANRLDLMNARGQLVDDWRQIKVSANALLGVLDVQYHLDSSTPPGRAEPFSFSSARSNHRLAFNWELPLVRRAERNNYRLALINFQRQRRSLQLSEDNVIVSVRQELRQLRLFAENYKIQQEQVALAYAQLENALDTFSAPAAPGQQAGAGSAAALTQQLLNAVRSLNQAQSNMYGVWIQYLTMRMQLYRDLELLPLDARGVWIDEYLSADRPPVQPGDGPARFAPPAGGERIPPAAGPEVRP